MIRLALLIPTLDRSGAEKQLTLLATHLPAAEFDVHVIALTRGGPYEGVLTEHGIPLTVLDKRHKLDVSAFRRLKATLRELQPHVLHTWLFAANSYGRLAVARPADTKVVVSERCVDSWKAGWQLWLDRRLISRTDRLIGNSQSVVDFYVEHGFPRDKTSFIYNGITPPPEESSSDRRAELLKECRLPHDARLVGIVGRLAKQKRISDLLWAMQILRQANDKSYLLIVGDGPERSALESVARDVECSEHVRFLGHRDDAATLMPCFDVVWLGSDFEGLSNSLMEAMSAGVPVVATNIPPNRELIDHGTEGFLVDVGDGVGFAQYTVKLFGDDDLAQTMGVAGRARIENDFSVQQMVDAHITLYCQLLNSQPSTLNSQP